MGAAVLEFLADSISRNIVKEIVLCRETIRFPSIKCERTVSDNLVLLDATSLFTNIPTTLCIKAIKKRWQRIKPHTFLTQKEFIDAVRLITTESYFCYRDHFYIQQAGLAMGNSISGFLANMVMEDLDENCIEKLPFRLPFYKRYVDDIITAIPLNETGTIVNCFNRYHKNLKFTVEEEVNHSINFLDMTLTSNEDGVIVTKWFQKEVSSGRYLHFKGQNPMSHKRNVATAITDRAIAFSNPKDRKQGIVKVKKLLDDNGYPKHFVEKGSERPSRSVLQR